MKSTLRPLIRFFLGCSLWLLAFSSFGWAESPRTSQHAMSRLLLEKFKIGKDITGEAGPVGSESSSDQSWKNSEILSYSKTHGAFKGVELNGATIKQDKKATVSLYGRYIPFASILNGDVPAPAEGQAFLTTIRKYTTRPSSTAETRFRPSRQQDVVEPRATSLLAPLPSSPPPAYPQH